jgi:phospholipid N-methyltransferase
VSVRLKKPRLGGKALLFARNFFRHPRMLGSLVPSSPFLIKRVLQRIDWSSARVIVEYGAGVGTFTGEILRRMRPDAVLVAFETNDEFVHYLRESLRDPRLHIVHGSADQVAAVLEGLKRGPADYVISGIPFSTIPEDRREAILRATREALRPRGALIVYQFTRSILPSLKRVFGRVSRDFEPRNILPAQLFYCTGAAADRAA